MPDQDIVLSILVVSHNQEGLLPRCLDSILAQRLDVPYEVIVSDDASTDGTWAVIEDYTRRYPGLLRGVPFDSSVVDPRHRSERCGANKANAYSHARGRYFVNVDGDDFLRGADVYQAQLALLEQHPSCSICMQNAWVLQDGQPIESGEVWGPAGEGRQTGDIIDARTFILDNLCNLNQTCMIRRVPGIDAAALHGKRFDDTVITYHHLQFGEVVYLDRADYVYVKYPTSIDSSLEGDDRNAVYWCLAPFYVGRVPRFAGLFMTRGLGEIVQLIDTLLARPMVLQSTTAGLLGQQDGFLFSYFRTGGFSRLGRLRLMAARAVASHLRTRGSRSPALLRLTYGLLVRINALWTMPSAWWATD